VDATGDVLGMLLSASQSGRQLPENVSFAADAQAIIAVLDTVGIRTQAVNGTQNLDPVDLTRAATRMTVLVSCWD
jgi:hypothetical protein